MNIPQITAGFSIGPFTITNTIVWTWLIVAVLSVVFIWLGHGPKVKPVGTNQVVAEAIYGAIGNMVNETMGPESRGFIPYFIALFSFLLVCNISGFWGMGIVRQPTADIATPLALAILTFLLNHGNSIRVNGIKNYLKGYIEPFPVLLPINILGELASPVSLTFRMFGNLLGGLIIGVLVYSMLIGSNAVPIWVVVASLVLCALLLTNQISKLKALHGMKKKLVMLLAVICFLPIGITLFIHGYFDIFAGFLQTYIFCLLSMVYITP